MYLQRNVKKSSAMIAAMVSIWLTGLLATPAYAICTHVFNPRCDSCGDDIGPSAKRIGQYCLMCESGYCISFFTDPNASKKAADLARALGGEPYASAEDGVVTYFEDVSSQSKPGMANGVVVPTSMLLKIAEKDLITAFVLSLFLPVNYDGGLNLLAGKGSTNAFPTISDVHDAIRGDLQALESRTRELFPDGASIVYEWTSEEIDDDVILTTFTKTAVNDPGNLIPKSLTDVETRVWVSRSNFEVFKFDQD